MQRIQSLMADLYGVLAAGRNEVFDLLDQFDAARSRVDSRETLVPVEMKRLVGIWRRLHESARETAQAAQNLGRRASGVEFGAGTPAPDHFPNYAEYVSSDRRVKWSKLKLKLQISDRYPSNAVASNEIGPLRPSSKSNCHRRQ